jgi:hypothetical protein
METSSMFFKTFRRPKLGNHVSEGLCSSDFLPFIVM